MKLHELNISMKFRFQDTLTLSFVDNKMTYNSSIKKEHKTLLLTY